MAIALDHSATFGPITTGTANTVTSSTGNLSVVSIILGISGAAAVTSVTDDKGNTYVSAGFRTGQVGGVDVELWYAKNATTGITAITVNWSGGGNGFIAVYDCSGAHAVSPLQAYTAWEATYADSLPADVGPGVGYSQGGGIAISVIHSNSAVTAVGSPWTFTGGTGGNQGFASMLPSSAGLYSPSWTTPSVSWWGITVYFASVLDPNWTLVRQAINVSSSAATSVTTTGVNTSAGDLVIIMGSADSGHQTSPIFTDSVGGNVWNTFTGMNPYSHAGGYDLYMGYSILVNGGVGQTFTFNFTSNTGNVVIVLVVTPRTTPTVNAQVTGTTSPANTAHTAASGTTTAGDLLFSAMTDGGAPTSFTANGSWILGGNEPDDATYDSCATAWQLNSAGGSTHDDFTTGSGNTSNEALVSFSVPALVVPLQGSGAGIGLVMDGGGFQGAF